jgi:hypothetical protein
MSDVTQNELDPAHETAVRQYLASQLEPQTGRAELRFRQFLVEQKSSASSAKQSAFRLPNRFGGWTLGIIGAALAASLAALWAGPSLKPVTPSESNSVAPIVTTPVNNPAFVEQDVQSQAFDDGTVMADGNTPVRVLRRRDTQRTRWFDQNENLQGEQVVPQDHVVYVPVKTY